MTDPRPLSPSLLAAAPHRGMFLAGATAVLATMTWWTLDLAAVRYAWGWMPRPDVPAGWAHGFFTQYGMLGPFIFGFLLTVFPRWMNQPALASRRFLPVFAGIFSGYLLAQAGLVWARPLVAIGVASMLAGWIAGMSALFSVLRADRYRNRSAVSCFAALGFGAAGIALFLAFLLGAPAYLGWASLKVGTFGLLLPVYFTVAHRMVPFFTNVVVPGYRMVRPTWSLPVLWALVLPHLALELLQEPRWRFVADLPLALFFGWHWLAWQPWKARRPGLLAVLHLALAWLPVAFVLFAADSLLALLSSGGSPLGRAPVHALTVGFFGSMLVAMVTRVTHGHSGRPLAMGPVPWYTFLALQAVVIARLAAEATPAGSAAYVFAAAGWVVAFLPWAARAVWIYLTPRRDGQPG